MTRSSPVLPEEARAPSGWTRVLHWLRYVNNILLLPMFTMLVLEVTPAYDIEFFASINLFFSAMFFAEWALGLALAEHRVGYLRDPSNIADLLSAIPFTVFAQVLRAFRVWRLFRVVRLMMRLRRFAGKSTRMIRALGLLSSVVFTGALAFRIVEPQSTVGLEQALWWSVVTLSTVGYGDVTPITPAGQVVASFVIFVGICVFGYMAGFIASLIDDPQQDEVLATVQRLEAQVGRLTDAVDSGQAAGPRGAIKTPRRSRSSPRSRPARARRRPPR